MATARHVLLFDLLALCGPGATRQPPPPPSLPHCALREGSGAGGPAGGGGGGDVPRSLDDVLVQLWGRPPEQGGALVLGFGLSGKD